MEYLVRYLTGHGDNDVNIEANSPRLAYERFLEEVEIVKEPVTVWNGETWITFTNHINALNEAESLPKGQISTPNLATTNFPRNPKGAHPLGSSKVPTVVKSAPRHSPTNPLIDHRDFLRQNSAYPSLRLVNLLSALALSIIIVLLAIAYFGEVEKGLVVGAVVGSIAGVLSYSLSSVIFDIADATINNSKNSMNN